MIKRDLSFHMANIYAEVKRAEKYKQIWDLEMFYWALQRMLDLFLKISLSKDIPLYRKIEIWRIKEAILSYFCWNNDLQIDSKFIETYFQPFVNKFVNR